MHAREVFRGERPERRSEKMLPVTRVATRGKLRFALMPAFAFLVGSPTQSRSSSREGAHLRLGARLAPAGFVVLSIVLATATAQAECLSGPCSGDLEAGQCGIDDEVCEAGNSGNPPECAGSGCNFVNNCRTPTVEGPFFDVLPTGGDTFAVRVVFDVRARWNKWASSQNPAGALSMFWYRGPSSALCENTDVTHCQYLASDHTECFLEQTGLTCDGAPYDFGTFFFRAEVCGGGCFCEQNPTFCSCWRRADRTVDFVVTKEVLGCPVPRKDDCKEDCASCHAVGGGCSFSRGGDAPVCTPLGSGPGALLRYAGGGVGGGGLPGTAEWTTALGRYWAHDFAQRIVVDPDPSHVWLLTGTATFREFSDPDGSGTYQTVSPSDEYRTLVETVSGWELLELDGTVHRFGADGLWLETEDRNGNARVATYSGGQLVSVALPDGRREDFGYHVDGKLASIAEVGVDETTSRAWSYTWLGEDLARIDRPDGTAWRFLYEDPRHPGILTQMILEATDASERVEAAFELDERGNVVRSWRGEVTAGPNGPVPGPGAVEVWSQSFDDPILPETTEVTDPLGQVAVFTLGRDASSSKAKVLSISGDCPVCSLGPNSQLFYEDPDHPLRPTRIVDGLGVETLMDYDAHGQVLSRIEALGEAEQRTTVWTYDATHPALVTSVEVPSVAGGAETRRTDWVLDGSGNALEQTISGVEAGSGFALTTVTTYNAAGQPLTVDPPGFGSDDQTSFGYDPARGDLVVTSRTDPLIGTTSYDHDPLNRRTSTVDVNGVESLTAYDQLDRVTELRRLGADPPADDLVTSHIYSPFGDLLRTLLPEGNVIEYGYDPAGRLVTVERKPDAATPGERVLYTLDEAGNRTLEELQRWDPGTSDWSTFSATAYDYSTRCHLDRLIQAPGTPEEAVTELQHDCKGNLSALWDPNHDPATEPPTTTYGYDTLNRLTTVSQPWAAGGGAVTTYAYDVQDHLVAVTDAEGNTTSYAYSDRDLLTQEISPVSGTTTHLYNEHGELVETTDGRGVTVTRGVDVLGRVTFIGYPDSTLDTTFTYDVQPSACAGESFPVGRLGAILRHGESVHACYDRHGRLTRDGEITLAYDSNGNRATIVYPGGVSASYAFDFADREVSLTVTTPGGVEGVVTSAAYLPSGPLASLGLGSGATETRAFDGRYLPAAITLDGAAARSWSYATDLVGNILEIVEEAACVPGPLVLENQTVSTNESFVSCTTIEAGSDFHIEAPGDVTFLAQGLIALGDGFSVGTGARFSAGSGSLELSRRSYAYQAPQYFLTGASGPWGERAWSYDKIGSRTSETRDGASPDLYQYLANPGGGNTPILEHVELGIGGTREYTWGPGGHLQEVAAGANVIDFAIDDEGRLSSALRAIAEVSAELSYDGRSFLRQAVETTGTPAEEAASVEALYDSQGLLHALSRRGAPEEPDELVVFLYFSGRPVAQLSLQDGTETWTYMTTDHLGTPLLATDDSGAAVWHGGFEPFGRDWQAETGAGASESGVFLRFPGQWVDTTWEDATLGAEIYYNVHRWYEPQTGRYTRVDPDPLVDPKVQLIYAYARQNPLRFIDPLGQRITHVDRSLEQMFNCAIRFGPPEFRQALNWLSKQRDDWGIHELGTARTGRRSEEYRRMRGTPPCAGSAVDQKNRVILVDTREPSCECVIEGIVREITELYAHRKLGMSADTALGFGDVSRYADPIVRQARDRACQECECMNGFPSSGRP